MKQIQVSVTNGKNFEILTLFEIKIFDLNNVRWQSNINDDKDADIEVAWRVWKTLLYEMWIWWKGNISIKHA